MPKYRRSQRAPYNVKLADTRGMGSTKEPRLIKSFWTKYKMDDVIVMDLNELEASIDIYLDEYIKRQIKNNKWWNFPVPQLYSREKKPKQS